MELARKELNQENLAKKIEELTQNKQMHDTEMASLSDLMRKLNMQASARARLNLKKTQQEEKEEAYKSRFDPIFYFPVKLLDKLINTTLAGMQEKKQNSQQFWGQNSPLMA